MADAETVFFPWDVLTDDHWLPHSWLRLDGTRFCLGRLTGCRFCRG